MPELSEVPEASHGPGLHVQAIVGGGFGGLFFYFGYHNMATFVWSFVGLIVVGSLISEAFRSGIASISVSLSVGVGVLLRGLLLFPFYWLVMAPYAALRRLGGADRLRLKFPAGRDSFWIDRRGEKIDYTRPY
jgi:hypothetical protein